MRPSFIFMLAETGLFDSMLLHFPGQHDQKDHGRRGAHTADMDRQVERVTGTDWFGRPKRKMVDVPPPEKARHDFQKLILYANVNERYGGRRYKYSSPDEYTVK